MIKVEAVSTEEEPVKFPILAKGLTSGIVVLFNKDTAGMVLETGKSTYDVGFFHAGWANVNLKSTWKILPPEYKFTISNASV